jgi:transcriptional regulator NrdR family protein
MKACEECGSNNIQVYNSREREGIGRGSERRIISNVRRNRKCGDCGARFSTIEVTEKEFKEMMESNKKLKSVIQALLEDF